MTERDFPKLKFCRTVLANSGVSKKQARNGISRRHIYASKITKGLQSILLHYPKNPKVGPNWRAGGPLAYPRRAKRDTFSDFLTSIFAKHQKIEGGPFRDFFPESLTMPKTTEKGDPLGFFNIHSVAKNF